MYLNPAHREDDQGELLKLIRDNPLGILTTAIPSTEHPLIQSSHIPWVLDVREKEDVHGPSEIILRGHIARSNPQAKALMQAAEKAADRSSVEQDVMVLFHGPAHGYVTPKFYTSTKPRTEKVVPTWNYAAAQAYGQIRCFYSGDHEADAFLSKQISDLSDQQERAAGHEVPWRVEQAPEKYIGILKRSIIGIEVKVNLLQGKFKMSQEMPLADREGVVDGFKNNGTEAGTVLSKLVESRLPSAIKT